MRYHACMGFRTVVQEVLAGTLKGGAGMDILNLDAEFRKMREKIYYLSIDNQVPIEKKAEVLGMTIGMLLHTLWQCDLMPHPTESRQMTNLINKAVAESVFGTPLSEVGAKMGLCEATVRALLDYRKKRKERFYDSEEELQVVYDLFVSGWSDVEIAERSEMEPAYVDVITNLFFKRKPQVIGFVGHQ